MSLVAGNQALDFNPTLVHRLTVSQVQRMLQAGILRDGDPIELIEGLLIRKDRSDAGENPMTHGERHADAVERLQRLAAQITALGLRLRSQLPVTLNEISEPEPDIAIVRRGAAEKPASHPKADEVVAIVEVADSSLAYDRTTKQRLYAKAGIPVYWIVNLPEELVEIYERPNPNSAVYEQRSVVRKGVAVRLRLSDDEFLDILASDILP